MSTYTYNPQLNGTRLAESIKLKLKDSIDRTISLNPSIRRASLRMILVGDNYASDLYVRFKEKACSLLGIDSQVDRLKSSISQSELEDRIRQLNSDDSLDAILLQLPLPSHLDQSRVLKIIDPGKDVDGLTPYNQGLLVNKNSEVVLPCTPQGILELIHQCRKDLSGSLAAVIGRSILVGKSTRLLLENNDCTTIGIHSKTLEASKLCRQADIVVVATGVPRLVTAEWIKKDAIVIDVGINKDAGNHTVGDVDATSVLNQTPNLTSVPGGVGPMTIAMLMKNCVMLWKRHLGLE